MRAGGLVRSFGRRSEADEVQRRAGDQRDHCTNAGLEEGKEGDAIWPVWTTKRVHKSVTFKGYKAVLKVTKGYTESYTKNPYVSRL